MTLIFSITWLTFMVLGLFEFSSHNDFMAAAFILSSSIMAFVVMSSYRLSVSLKTIAESLKALADIVNNFSNKKEEK